MSLQWRKYLPLSACLLIGYIGIFTLSKVNFSTFTFSAFTFNIPVFSPFKALTFVPFSEEDKIFYFNLFFKKWFPSLPKMKQYKSNQLQLNLNINLVPVQLLLLLLGHIIYLGILLYIATVNPALIFLLGFFVLLLAISILLKTFINFAFIKIVIKHYQKEIILILELTLWTSLAIIFGYGIFHLIKLILTVGTISEAMGGSASKADGNEPDFDGDEPDFGPPLGPDSGSRENFWYKIWRKVKGWVLGVKPKEPESTKAKQPTEPNTEALNAEIEAEALRAQAEAEALRAETLRAQAAFNPEVEALKAQALNAEIEAEALRAQVETVALNAEADAGVLAILRVQADAAKAEAEALGAETLRAQAEVEALRAETLRAQAALNHEAEALKAQANAEILRVLRANVEAAQVEAETLRAEANVAKAKFKVADAELEETIKGLKVQKSNIDARIKAAKALNLVVKAQTPGIKLQELNTKSEQIKSIIAGFKVLNKNKARTFKAKADAAEVNALGAEVEVLRAELKAKAEAVKFSTEAAKLEAEAEKLRAAANLSKACASRLIAEAEAFASALKAEARPLKELEEAFKSEAPIRALNVLRAQVDAIVTEGEARKAEDEVLRARNPIVYDLGYNFFRSRNDNSLDPALAQKGLGDLVPDIATFENSNAFRNEEWSNIEEERNEAIRKMRESSESIKDCLIIINELNQFLKGLRWSDNPKDLQMPLKGKVEPGSDATIFEVYHKYTETTTYFRTMLETERRSLNFARIDYEMHNAALEELYPELSKID